MSKTKYLEEGPVKELFLLWAIFHLVRYLEGFSLSWIKESWTGLVLGLFNTRYMPFTKCCE